MEAKVAKMEEIDVFLRRLSKGQTMLEKIGQQVTELVFLKIVLNSAGRGKSYDRGETGGRSIEHNGEISKSA